MATKINKNATSIIHSEVVIDGINTKQCLKCAEIKSAKGSNNKFYSHRNKYIDNRFSICKECIEQIGLEDNIEDIHLTLRTLDLPFVPSKWDECTSSENTLTAYMSGKGINIPKAKYGDKVIMEMHYSDSPTCNEIKDVSSFLISSDEQKLENITKWGEHYSEAEYMKMNISVENNIKITSRDDYQSIKNFERVARAEVERDRAYANIALRPSDKKSAEDNVTNMMKQSGLSYEQTNRNNTDSTLGTDIRDIIENYDPVPIATEEFSDVDNIQKYIYRFLLRPLLRAMGKDNSLTKDDYDEVRKEIKEKEAKYSNMGTTT